MNIHLGKFWFFTNKRLYVILTNVSLDKHKSGKTKINQLELIWTLKRNENEDEKNIISINCRIFCDCSIICRSTGTYTQWPMKQV